MRPNWSWLWMLPTIYQGMRMKTLGGFSWHEHACAHKQIFWLLRLPDVLNFKGQLLIFSCPQLQLIPSNLAFCQSNCPWEEGGAEQRGASLACKGPCGYFELWGWWRSHPAPTHWYLFWSYYPLGWIILHTFQMCQVLNNWSEYICS